MLKAIWEYLGKQALFIFLITNFCKSLFLLNSWSYLDNESFTEIVKMYGNSFSLDLAVVSYILILPLIAFLIQLFVSRRNFIHPFVLSYYTFVFALIFTISYIDIELFSYWNSKLSAKALSFLNTPNMVFKSAGKWDLIHLLFLIIVSTTFSSFLLRWNSNSTIVSKLNKPVGVVVCGMLSGLLLLGLRGGLREIPINQSDAYYSQNPVLNVAGVNSFWNLGNVIFQNTNNLNHNPYKTMGDDQATEIFRSLYTAPSDSNIFLFNQSSPNIVYIAMEGVNANCIKEFNAKNDYMPELSKILKESYSFSNMYASGMRTDQGLVAVLSGFPALPLHTIGAQPEKFQALPSFSLALKEKNYDCKFFFAGEPEFGSFKAFLIHNGFEKVYSFKDFDKDQLSQELGAPDQDLFDKFIEDMQSPSEPFFSLILTQTTHEPFDMPFNEAIAEESDRYINTVKYLDDVIGSWHEQCKDFPWYDNTIFIISSDHAHPYPEKYWYTDKERYHIPFILFGGALKEEFKGISNPQLVNQTDIPYSLGKQLQLKEQKFEFSKNIWNPYSQEFSSFIHIHGHNWIRKDQVCSVNYEISNDFSEASEASCELENAAYMQYVFKRYMEY